MVILPSGFVGQAGKFVVKHAVAASVVVAGSVAFSVLLYLALLLWAVITNGGLGGPLALPGMMLVAFVGSAAAAIIVFLPVTAMAHVICARVGKFRWIAEIAVSTILLITGVVAMTFATDGARTAAIGSKAQIATALSIILLIPVGIYWWSAQATEMMIRAAMRAWHTMTTAWRKGHAA